MLLGLSFKRTLRVLLLPGVRYLEVSVGAPEEPKPPAPTSRDSGRGFVHRNQGLGNYDDGESGGYRFRRVRTDRVSDRHGRRGVEVGTGCW